jgi:hypothetical protein
VGYAYDASGNRVKKGGANASSYLVDSTEAFPQSHWKQRGRRARLTCAECNWYARRGSDQRPRTCSRCTGSWALAWGQWSAIERMRVRQSSLRRWRKLYQLIGLDRMKREPESIARYERMIQFAHQSQFAANR